MLNVLNAPRKNIQGDGAVGEAWNTGFPRKAQRKVSTRVTGVSWLMAMTGAMCQS